MLCRCLPRKGLVALSAALLAFVSHGARVVYDWDVTYVTVNRDGYNTRRAIGVNNELPIPPIEATIGDTLVLNVHNSLDVPTSVHSHGLFHRGTNYLDGATMVTQCGIPPGESFTYEYVVRQTGTFWMHGHNLHQNSDGLRTPLIIHDDGDAPFEYDEEFHFSFEDWYPSEFAARIKVTLDPNGPFPPSPTFPYALINGYNGNDTKPIRFKPGRTYRIRVVNMSTTEWFKFSLPGHKLRVIEADGIYSEPLEVDGLDLSPGQRYSALVTAYDSDEYNYNYKVTLYADFVPNNAGMSPRYYQGLVEYSKDAPLKDVVVDETAMVYAKDIELSALDHEPELPVDRSIALSIGNNPYSNGLHLDHINNITYAQPLIPSLYTALTMGDLATNEEVYGPQTHAIVLNHNEVVELVISNPNDLPHPLHLHGHAFQITEYGPVSTPIPPKFGNPPVVMYSGAPMKRDTMSIPEYQYIKVRFKADNPGVWLLHCHMDIHFAMGMVLTFIEAPDVLQETQKPTQLQLDHCAMQGIKTSGNAAGNQGLDLTGLPTPPTVVGRNTPPPSTGRS
ncbi:hypothetical protein GQ54DRAFT_296830 [Martensiomyces pterosporus]|nr:hypothetical protein GQ54DRAFT_296830 [Martensiomyces pterosporus]